MNIGVDIDGVITTGWGIHGTLLKYFGLSYNRESQDYSFMKTYGLTQEQWEDFLRNGLAIGYKKETPQMYAEHIINKLRSEGHKIILITARSIDDIEVTKEWLQSYGIKYDKLIHDTDKSSVCLKEGISVMLEDNFDNAVACAEAGIKTYLFHAPYNANFNHPKIIRIKNWTELINGENKL